ncbi:MAG: hypothetical protein QME52_00865 [Bacteroidota bacterium]|nr:hypothetical protein [Bacteroidota bacterium]
MNHLDGIGVSVTKDIENIEIILKIFWDKVRIVSEQINRLKEEKKSLQQNQNDMDGELHRLRSQLNEKEQEIKRLRVEQVQLLNMSNDEQFTKQEKEFLKERIRDLISKINSHL